MKKVNPNSCKKDMFIVIFLPLLVLTSFVYGQDKLWTIEFSSGLKSEFFESTNHNATGWELKTGRRIAFPQIDMNLWCGINEYFSVESGLAFISYNTNWAYGLNPEKKTTFIAKHQLYSALQVPLRARFNVPLNNKFHFFSTSGIAFQFPLQPKIPNGWFPENSPYQEFSGEIDYSWGKADYHLFAFAPMCGINILLNMKMGFTYKFNSGIGISVFGEYYKGTRTMALIDGFYSKTRNNSNTLIDAFSSYETKGDYWNAGIGISYIFWSEKEK